MSVSQILFPFEYVKKDSKIIIYGLGTYGVSYIEQVEATKWCEIVGLSDSEKRKAIQEYPYLAVEKLADTRADYIVIAIAAVEMVNQVYRKLTDCGIPECKIISTLNRTQKDYRYRMVPVEKGDKLQILLRLRGGLGDYVVYLSVYERITNMLQKVEIDVKCRPVYGKALYARKKYIRSLMDEDAAVDFNRYDLVLQLEHGIQVLRCDEERCDRISAELSNKIGLLIDNFDDMAKDIQEAQYRFAIQIRRACVRGWDRYRALGHGDILDLNAGMVHVDLTEEYLREYEKLRLKKYLTINRGADKLSSHIKSQTKVWPYEYYERLISLLKRKFPEYEIVQLGGEDTEHIEGVDRFLQGQSLELIKYVLKNSSLHFDCEGGLVHLATALGTKCAVVFGPTSMQYYGYPQNMNITAGKCYNCMNLLKDWYVECLRGETAPECMYGITPEMVFEKISRYLDSKQGSEWHCQR